MVKKIKILLCLVIALLVLVIAALCILQKNLLSKPDSKNAGISDEHQSDMQHNKKGKAEKSLSNMMDEYIDRYHLRDEVSIYVNDFHDQVYVHNIDMNFFAASIYKVPLAMIYYEKIKRREVSFSDNLLYQDYHYEEGGPIGDTYIVGTYIDVATLLHDMIVYSDNTAAHILFENLGGWTDFKKEIAKYSNSKLDENFLTMENVLNASYMNDVMSYLYQKQNDFEDLLDDMKKSTEFDYLSTYVNVNIAQKHGCYEQAVNSVGLVFGIKPYSIVIFTTLGEDGVEHIGKINQICYNYFNGY